MGTLNKNTMPQQTAPSNGGQANLPPATFANTRPRSDRGNYLRPIDAERAGTYTLRINRVGQNWSNPRAAYDDGRPQPNADAKASFNKRDNYFVEFEVVESNVPDCPPGFLGNWTTNDRYPDSYFADVKGFLCAATGADADAVDADDWMASYGSEQLLAGMLVKCSVREKSTRDGGRFTLHVFSPVPQKDE